MRLGHVYSALLAITQHVGAVPAGSDRSSGLDVTLSSTGDTRVKAVVKNVGQEEVTFVHLNFFGDKAPVKKVTVYQNDNEVAFDGIKRRIKLQDISSESLTTLKVGEEVEDEFDIAATVDLSNGGPVLLHSKGLVALSNNGEVSGYLHYDSNKLQIEVDAVKASQVTKAIKTLERRTRLSCNNANLNSTLQAALRDTAVLANAAALAAAFGSADKFQEYFKSTDSSVRATVAARLRAVAAEASSTTSGSTVYYCTDTWGYCEPNVLAYTIPSRNVIVNCGIYYSYLPEITNRCHRQDRATTSLHEFTHAPGVYNPGTEDLGYGYTAAMGLNSQQAVMNADTYALYANAIYSHC